MKIRLLLQCHPLTIDMFTINIKIHYFRSHSGCIGCFASVSAPMLVAHGGNHQGAASNTQRRDDNPELGGDVRPVERPGDGQGLVPLPHDARCLCKVSLVEDVASK